MSDALTIKFGFQLQENASVYSTPNSISQSDISFASPALNVSSIFTVTATSPQLLPAFMVQRFAFSQDNFQFQFNLCGNGNVVVTFDDPAVQQLDPSLIVLVQTDSFESYLGASAGSSQVPILTRNPTGAIGGGFGGPINTHLSIAPKDAFTGGNFTSPNVPFNCTVYCY